MAWGSSWGSSWSGVWGEPAPVVSNDIWGESWAASWGDSWGLSGYVAPPEEAVALPGIWRRDKKKRKSRVIRYSDFATREEFQAEVRKAIPIPRPPVVDSASDADDDFVVSTLLRLLDD
jgi:hypothetical protein